jgi:hypothetical protein
MSERMESWQTVRRVVTLVLLLLATAEIFACAAIASPGCLFSSHVTHDCDDGCSGDGCLCCCAHIVVVQPIRTLARPELAGETIVVSDLNTHDIAPNRIEHPPRS